MPTTNRELINLSSMQKLFELARKDKQVEFISEMAKLLRVARQIGREDMDGQRDKEN